MKNKILILFILIVCNISAQESGKVEYEFSYKTPDTPAKSEMQKRARKNVNLSAEYATNHQYILDFNKKESIYYVEDSMPIDGVDNAFAYKFSKFFFSSGIYYQNLETNESLNELLTMDEYYLVQGKLQSNWEITSETKQIGKYKCIKAISNCKSCNENQKVTVWFSPDIPFSFGPAGYGGLSGLILEISKFRYTLKLKKIKLYDKELKITKPTKGKKISQEDLKELQMKKRKEMMSEREN